MFEGSASRHDGLHCGPEILDLDGTTFSSALLNNIKVWVQFLSVMHMSSEDTVKNIQIVDALPITRDMTLPTSYSPPSSLVSFRASQLAGFPDL